eukprot:6834255-Prymnesium_polylepis.1
MRRVRCGAAAAGERRRAKLQHKLLGRDSQVQSGCRCRCEARLRVAPGHPSAAVAHARSAAHHCGASSASNCCISSSSDEEKMSRSSRRSRSSRSSTAITDRACFEPFAVWIADRIAAANCGS